jgi:hypothetical protein
MAPIIDFCGIRRHALAMPSTRPPSIADLFKGGDKLRDLFEIVGMVVTNFGGIEETLRYLDWQLQAYAHATAMPTGTPENDVQIALGAPRSAYFSRHLILSAILRGIDTGIAHPSVTAALGAEAANITAQWQGLKATAQDLGKRRNALAHAAIGVSGASLVRSLGLLAQPQTVNPLDVLPPRLLDGLVAVAEDMGIGRSMKGEPRLPHRDHGGNSSYLMAKTCASACVSMRPPSFLYHSYIILVVPEEAWIFPLDLHPVGGDGVDFVLQTCIRHRKSCSRGPAPTSRAGVRRRVRGPHLV